jgi:beta-lactamase regulating signal transducer with metallopeptidase domain
MLEQHSDLILSLAKFTSALLIAFAVAPFLKRPALRATFWAGMFIILPTVIFATHGRSILNILPQLSTAPEIENVQPLAPVAEVVAIPAIPADLPEMPRIAPQAPARKTNWVATVFFTGMAVSLLPILIAILRIRFIPKKPAGVSAMDAWAKIRPQGSPAVPLYLTSSPFAPFTIGLIREAVLLPESSAGWSLRRLRSTLYHEAAHISRKDPLIRMFASLVRAIFWFHPLVWLAHRQLVAAQEEACDEIALAAGIPADEYAEDLLETAKYSQAAFGHGLSMARWSQLGSRIHLILQNKTTETKPLTMKTIAIVSIGIAATTFGLSSLGYSQAPNAVDKPTELETAVTATDSAVTISSEVTAVAPGAAIITKKLDQIIIPKIVFEDTTLEEAIDFLRLRAVELDVAEKDPEKKGINIVIRRPRPAKEEGDGVAPEAADPGALRINELRLVNVPLGIVLKYVCDATEMAYKVDDFAVTIVPIAEAGEDPAAVRVPALDQ